MGKYTKDLSDSPAIDKESITVVSETTTNETYKTTLDDFINSSLKDIVTFSDSIGTLTKPEGTAATLSNEDDFDAIDIGTVILPDGSSPNVVVAKDTFISSPNITVLDSPPLGSASFSYGPYTMATRDVAGNYTNVLSTGGLSVGGDSLITGTLDVSGEAKVDSSIETNGNLTVQGSIFCTSYKPRTGSDWSAIQDLGGVRNIQQSVNDGMIVTSYAPACNAGITTNQVGVPFVTETTVNFNRVNGSDDAEATFIRNPSGNGGFDTTNHAFIVPYDTSYSLVSYLVTATLKVTANVVVDSVISVRIVSGSSATTFDYTLGSFNKRFLIADATPKYYSVSANRIVRLNPSTVPEHRYLMIRIFHSCTTLDISNIDDGSSFCVTSLG